MSAGGGAARGGGRSAVMPDAPLRLAATILWLARARGGVPDPPVATPSHPTAAKTNAKQVPTTHVKVRVPKRYGVVHYAAEDGTEQKAKGGEIVVMPRTQANDIGAEPVA